MKAKRTKSAAVNSRTPASRKPAVKAISKSAPAKRKTTSSSPPKVSLPVKKEITIIKSPFWNIWDAGDEYKIRISVPGLRKKDIKVSVNGNNLTIGSDSENKSEQSKKNYVVREYSYNAWSRTVALPKKVKPEDIKIKYKDGVLKLDLPKAGKQ